MLSAERKGEKLAVCNWQWAIGKFLDVKIVCNKMKRVTAFGTTFCFVGVQVSPQHT